MVIDNDDDDHDYKDNDEYFNVSLLCTTNAVASHVLSYFYDSNKTSHHCMILAKIDLQALNLLPERT